MVFKQQRHVDVYVSAALAGADPAESHVHCSFVGVVRNDSQVV